MHYRLSNLSVPGHLQCRPRALGYTRRMLMVIFGAGHPRTLQRHLATMCISGLMITTLGGPACQSAISRHLQRIWRHRATVFEAPHILPYLRERSNERRTALASTTTPKQGLFLAKQLAGNHQFLN